MPGNNGPRMSANQTDLTQPHHTPGRLRPGLAYALLGLIVLAWLITAVAHRASPLYLNHVSGAWVAMSHWATQGVFYPPLESDGVFGGTRFGPLAIALQAGVHALSGDAIAGPKLLHAVYMLALCLGLYMAMARLDLSTHVRCLLALAPLCTWIGWTAGLSIRHDALAAALQVWAVVALLKQEKPAVATVLVAAVLAGLAALVKASALWGAAAGFFYLAFYAPKRLAFYVPCGIGVLVGGMGLSELFSDGQFSANMRDCLFAGGDKAGGWSVGLLTSTASRVAQILIVEPVVWLLLPMSVVGVIRGWRSAPLIAWACAMVWLMSAYLMTRSGIDGNHLIDLVAVSSLGAGLWLSSSGRQVSQRARIRSYAFDALMLLMLISFITPARHTGKLGQRLAHIGDAAMHLAGVKPIKSARRHVLDQLEPGESVVSYNPMVPVLLGQDPVVVDSWMQRLYFIEHPASEKAWVQRVVDREFDAFVFGVNVGPELDFHPQHFGQATLQAVREHYELTDVHAYAVFRPKSDTP